MQYCHCWILEKYHLLSFEDLKLFSNACLLHRIVNGSAPPPLRYFLSLCSTKSTRTSSTDCSVPICHFAFSVKARTQCHTLPDDMKTCNSVSSFKNKLKHSYITAFKLNNIFCLCVNFVFCAVFVIVYFFSDFL